MQSRGEQQKSGGATRGRRVQGGVGVERPRGRIDHVDQAHTDLDDAEARPGTQPQRERSRAVGQTPGGETGDQYRGHHAQERPAEPGRGVSKVPGPGGHCEGDEAGADHADGAPLDRRQPGRQHPRGDDPGDGDRGGQRRGDDVDRNQRSAAT